MGQLQDTLAPQERGLSLAKVHSRGRHQAQAGVVVLVVVRVKELVPQVRASASLPKRSGKVG